MGEQEQLVAIADFVDQEDVLLPGDYLSWSSQKGAVASIAETGLVTVLAEGTTIFTASRDGIEAVTLSYGRSKCEQ